MQDQERVGFNDVHDAVPDGGEEGNVDHVSVGVFEADIPHWLHVFFRQQDPDRLNDSSNGDLPLVLDFIELMDRDSAAFPERFLVGVERMIRDEKAEEIAFPEEFFVFVDRGGFLEFDMDRSDRHQFEHVELAGFFSLFIRAAGGDNPVQSDEEFSPFAEVVERADFDQAFQRPPSDEFQVDAFREVVEVLKRPVFAALADDQFNRRFPGVLDRAEAKADLTFVLRRVFDGEFPVGCVELRREDVDPQITAFVDIKRDFRRIAMVGVERRAHVFDRIVFLEEGGLD